jgi:hypothetical protein
MAITRIDNGLGDDDRRISECLTILAVHEKGGVEVGDQNCDTGETGNETDPEVEALRLARSERRILWLPLPAICASYAP